MTRCATRFANGSARTALGEDGRPDRAAIARVVFADRDALAWLEALLHPLVVREYMTWRAELADRPDPPSVAATEVPLLYEVGGETRFDAVVVITAPRDLRSPARTSRSRPENGG